MPTRPPEDTHNQGTAGSPRHRPPWLRPPTAPSALRRDRAGSQNHQQLDTPETKALLDRHGIPWLRPPTASSELPPGVALHWSACAHTLRRCCDPQPLLHVAWYRRQARSSRPPALLFCHPARTPATASHFSHATRRLAATAAAAAAALLVLASSLVAPAAASENGTGGCTCATRRESGLGARVLSGVREAGRSRRRAAARTSACLELAFAQASI